MRSEYDATIWIQGRRGGVLGCVVLELQLRASHKPTPDGHGRVRCGSGLGSCRVGVGPVRRESIRPARLPEV